MPDDGANIVSPPPDTLCEDHAALLAALMRFSGAPCDQASLLVARESSPLPSGLSGVMELASRVGFSVNLIRSGVRKAAAVRLPALAEMRDGRMVLLGRIDHQRALTLAPDTGHPKEVERAAFDANWTGRLIVSRGNHRKQGLRPGWFLASSRRHAGALVQTLLASLFVQIFGLITPLFSMIVIDKVLSSSTLTTLDVLAIGMALITVFEVAMGGLRGLLLSHTTNRLDAELGARLVDHLLSLPLAYFESRPVGALAARAKELDTIRTLLTGPGLSIGLDVVFTLVFIAVMVSLSGSMTAIVVVTVLLFAVIHLIVTPALKSVLSDRFTRGADAQSFLIEALNGIETLKAVSAEPHVRHRWQRLLVANSQAAFRATILSEVSGQAVSFLNKAMTIAILWYGARLVVEGTITAGTLIGFNMMAGRVSGPVLRLTQMWQQVQQGRVALQKLGDVLNAQPEPGANPGRTPLGRVEGRIVFRDVTFRYGPRAPAALESLSFAVPAGQVVGIVGLTGSGKSTLIKLLQRLYVPERGSVSIDGVDLSGVDPAWLRPQIGVVPQEVVLFNRSVRENIALSDPSLPMERIEAAARLAGAHGFIIAQPDAYDTVIGERGSRLSGGQRQCLALARALVTDPRVLILDEATSALDYETEAIVHRNMRQICAGRTVFIVAHRLAALRGADRILVLERGRIIEDGTHAALIAARGRYARLHAIQAGTLTPPPRPAAPEARP